MFIEWAGILPCMLRLGSQYKVLSVLFCIVVVTLRFSGAHLHLCLDGSEPPAVMHFDGDAGLHHMGDSSHADATGHADVDVNLIADALLKHSDNGLNLLAALAAFFLFLNLSPFVSRLLRHVEFLLPINAHRAHLRPLLRGPPR